ncbi:2-phospho-L-lactate guanylyltransferase [Striga asiatica]|uniref:2-phospho-L-lactate guanylyltransferase n=1 Tax=Striga asiatica TaxID=4170 RepID=A0A5A7R5H2_STRAF|nr:2-phospho-L-lactate guanylyltransferase [Striga asiatica]
MRVPGDRTSLCASGVVRVRDARWARLTCVRVGHWRDSRGSVCRCAGRHWGSCSLLGCHRVVRDRAGVASHWSCRSLVENWYIVWNLRGWPSAARAVLHRPPDLPSGRPLAGNDDERIRRGPGAATCRIMSAIHIYFEMVSVMTVNKSVSPSIAVLRRCLHKTPQFSFLASCNGELGFTFQINTLEDPICYMDSSTGIGHGLYVKYMQLFFTKPRSPKSTSHTAPAPQSSLKSSRSQTEGSNQIVVMQGESPQLQNQETEASTSIQDNNRPSNLPITALIPVPDRDLDLHKSSTHMPLITARGSSDAPFPKSTSDIKQPDTSANANLQMMETSKAMEIEGAEVDEHIATSTPAYKSGLWDSQNLEKEQNQGWETSKRASPSNSH